MGDPTVTILRGGAPVKSTILTNTDKSTLLGDGSRDRPLAAVGGGSASEYFLAQNVEVDNPDTAFADVLTLTFNATAGAWRVGWKASLSVETEVEGVAAEAQLVRDSVVISGPFQSNVQLGYAGGFASFELEADAVVSVSLQLRRVPGAGGIRAIASNPRIEAWPVTIPSD